MRMQCCHLLDAQLILSQTTPPCNQRPNSDDQQPASRVQRKPTKVQPEEATVTVDQSESAREGEDRMRLDTLKRGRHLHGPSLGQPHLL